MPMDKNVLFFRKTSFTIPLEKPYLKVKFVVGNKVSLNKTS
jgi:hypothetical protein